METPLKTVLNFRDVGQTINDRMKREYLKTNTLYRGARPDEASVEDRQRLWDNYRIRTIIDLRTKTEHIQQAQKRDAKIKSSELSPQSNDDTAEPLKIPSIQYHEINFNGWAFSRRLMSKLSWWDFGRLISLMATGYRIEAIRILGEKVMRDMGLIGLATNSLDVCTAEVLQVFRVLAEPENYPLMLHCTQGKDRTGLTVLLALLLSDVSLDAINHDYMMSGSELAPEREERLKEIHSIGLTDEFADCDPKLVYAVASHIRRNYGSIGEYLDWCGVSSTLRKDVRDILRADGFGLIRCPPEGSSGESANS